MNGPGIEDLVHHMTLYAAGNAEPPIPVGQLFDCTKQQGSSRGLPIIIIDRCVPVPASAPVY